MSRPIVGRRMIAGLLDVLVPVVLLVAVGAAFGEGHAGHGSAAVMLHGVSTVLSVLLALTYYVVTEASSRQTLCERVVGIRVVTIDGAGPSTVAIAVRTTKRVVDFLGG
ncbi:MAG TPA: RDD family protein, partial [Acidimicrobiia bacterium]